MTPSTDARSRALRTFVQGLAYTIIAALVVSVTAAVTTSASWAQFGATLVGFAFFQSVATAVLSWLMRSWFPPPSNDDPAPGQD